MVSLVNILLLLYNKHSAVYASALGSGSGDTYAGATLINFLKLERLASSLPNNVRSWAYVIFESVFMIPVQDVSAL